MRAIHGRARGVVAGLLVAVGLGGCMGTPPAPTPVALAATPAASAAAPSVTGSPARPPVPSSIPASVTPAGPIGAAGTVAVLGRDGSLWLVEASGRSVLLAGTIDGIFHFPAWSPDGSRIAAVRSGARTSIVVFEPEDALASGGAEPLVVFESPAIEPFYLSWLPDGRTISFLANEGGGLSLRLAPADGSAPLDGSGPGSAVGSGSPFYFDWITDDRLFAHVGTGPDAVLGELGRDGKAAAPPVESPGDFRSGAVSDDGRLLGYVRAVEDAGEVVLASRDGTGERRMPVFGAAGVVFEPGGSRLAAIGGIAPRAGALEIPLGPLRLLDESGDVVTLLDGDVLSFWWSPDATTIAALRVQPVAAPAGSASPVPSATSVDTEARLLFVDVETRTIRSSVVVQPGQLFIQQVLSFFDQYALSHRLWSPDSATLLFPVVGADGVTRVALMAADGGDPVLIDGQAAFWSP